MSTRTQEWKFLSSVLRSIGLSLDLNDAFKHMGQMVRDHKHLETLLSGENPEVRQATYEALRPHLSFEAKPLAQYEAAAAHDAERRQLPTIDEKGQIHDFRPASDFSSLAQEAIAARTLTLICSKCTKIGTFYALDNETLVGTTIRAREAGWVYDHQADPPVEICPDCPTSLRNG